MAKKMYVGNLPWSCTNTELETMFQPHGNVLSAEVIMDRESGRSRGFGFVEMDSPEEVSRAVSALNGSEMGGRTLVVNEALPRQPRRDGGGGNRGGGGGRY
ncbi:RNA recognition motif domain-containing protein [Lignipirellula cremea]|uniref:RNA recognition motif (RRM, RBD, or RNP domain) n=1 Tax=Lignipirellula cremea TaxID=2528010 RepID=A0A518DX03_9BACT|nr:RNA-binding protein [Lignipirellula cremea]QDU96363.1 RNA recognition motif (RRM, RBD, or RNP domain) [Lignipirellula cremea]